jgi:hypothetical protein
MSQDDSVSDPGAATSTSGSVKYPAINLSVITKFSKWNVPKMKNLRIRSMVGLVVLSLTMVASLFPSVKSLKELMVVQARGEAGVVTVVSTQCSNHGQINYRFDSEGKSDLGHFSSCQVPCASLKSGDLLHIRTSYDDERRLVECGDVADKIDIEWHRIETVVIMVAFLLVTMILMVLVRLR